MEANILDSFCIVVLYETRDSEYATDANEILAKNYIEEIFNSFSSNLSNQFSNDFEINIRYICNKNIDLLKQLSDEFSVILYLIMIDLHMVSYQEFWNQYINECLKQHQNYIYPIALTKYFTRMASITKYQCLQIFKHDNVNIMLKLHIAKKILDILISKTTENLMTKASIFISYTQKDFGLDFAWKITEWINKNTMLDSFLDFYNLPTGEMFEDHISKNLEKDHNLFLAIKTDNYTTRMWCIHEILSARKIEIPILVVDSVMLEEKRTFPYLANCKTIRADIETSNDKCNINEIKNIDYIICEAVVELLRVRINILNQNHIKKTLDFKSIKTLNSQPDLFNLLYSFKNIDLISEQKTTFIYPDPPISKKEEIEIKGLISNKFDLITNSFSVVNYIQQQEKSLVTHLESLLFGISIATPCDIQKYGYIENHLYSYLIEIGRCFIYSNLKMAYGGDIKYSSNMSYMKAFAIMTEYYRENKNYKVTNFLTERTKGRISLEEKTKYEEYIDFIEPKIYMQDKYKKNEMIYVSKAQSNMRIHMNELIGARIIIGGRIKSKKAFSGLLEEFLLARESKLPIYLIGTFGGMSKIIGDLIFGFISPKELQSITFIGDSEVKKMYEDIEGYSKDYIDILSAYHCKLDVFNNGLNEEENIRLFKCKDPKEAFRLIIKGMLNYIKSDIS